MCNCNNVGGESNRRRCDCDCVFRCLLELLEDALEEENNETVNCRDACRRCDWCRCRNIRF